jgi:hypothetical protein
MTFNYKKFDLPAGTFKKPSVLVIVFSICFAFWFLDFWKSYNTAKKHNSFVWDVMNYYSYLPATFLNNGSFDFHQGADSLYIPIGPLDSFVPKTTYGMSVMYAPFFALGYKIAYNQQSPLNGFSEPFATCIHWGSIIYVLLGMVFLRKFLLAYFNETVTAITLTATLFGTMLFMYTYTIGELSHGYLFSLFSIFLYLTQKWHLEPKIRITILIGIVTGLISLIRPTEIYIFLFFIFWNVRKLSDLKPKLRLLAGKYGHLLLILLIGFLLWVPQFLFWKVHTGSYFYFSYPGERFFWDDPQIINILFSYRKGWITYTPLVIMSFVGFFFVKKEFPVSKWFFIFITVLMVYVLSCWWDWLFGGCFGARGFCQNIAYLSVPFAFFIDFVFYSPGKIVFRNLLTLVTIVFIFSCVCLNIGQTYQYMHSRIHYDGMTRKVYWDVFRKFQYDDKYEFQYWGDLDSPDYAKMRSGEDRDQ